VTSPRLDLGDGRVDDAHDVGAVAFHDWVEDFARVGIDADGLDLGGTLAAVEAHDLGGAFRCVRPTVHF